MRPECRKLLEDMRDTAAKVAAFTQGKSLDAYLRDEQLRWSVERGFEIIGEALNQLRKFDASLASKISESRKIISFRNILIHGYSRIDPARTWDVIQNDLPVLHREVVALLA